MDGGDELGPGHGKEADGNAPFPTGKGRNCGVETAAARTTRPSEQQPRGILPGPQVPALARALALTRPPTQRPLVLRRS